MRKTFEYEIQKLKDEILSLGSMVEKALLDSIDSLKNRDIPRSQEIYDNDEKINKKRFKIERAVMIAIATQQPMAHDLRLLASLLDVAGELERMGDYAKGIAKINILMGEQKLLKPLIDLPRMAEKSVDMLHRAITAFINEDVKAAEEIPLEDDTIDELYTQIYRELITYVIEEPSAIERSNWLLWAAHNLERVGDRVTNICERTIFIATGEMEEASISDDEMTI
ncbi:MAG: phosphate signaling complex protein PhoU [Chloroflexi bacterium]|nr:phosphate signaling complex protein PhoU [Chloroflexota bacterium]